MPESMRAISVAKTGGPEVLEWGELPVPEPGVGELLVRVAAAGVNFIDTYHRDGLYPMELPFTPGVEGAGTVEAIGEGAGMAVGDRVAWADVLGSYAEYALVTADRAVVIPDGVTSDVAAAAMLQGLTAHYLVTDTYPLAKGDLCLIHAGAGGVGGLLIQLAKMRGATVFTTASTGEKTETARAAGADHVINYSEVDFGDVVEEIAGERALDVVYDGVGADTVERGLRLLRPRGVFVTFGNSSGRPPKIDPLQLMRLGSLYITRPTLFDYITEREELEQRAAEVFAWIAGGQLDVHIGARFPVADAAGAHRALEGRRTTGKVLLEP